MVAADRIDPHGGQAEKQVPLMMARIAPGVPDDDAGVGAFVIVGVVAVVATDLLGPGGKSKPAQAAAKAGSRKVGTVIFRDVLPSTTIRLAKDSVHFRQMNTQLRAAMDASPELKKALEEAVPGLDKFLRKNKRGLLPDKAPPGTIWHHEAGLAVEGTKPGEFSLVPKEGPGGHWEAWRGHHPSNRGGRNTWGGGTDHR
jgi:hypothetical protein